LCRVAEKRTATLRAVYCCTVGELHWHVGGGKWGLGNGNEQALICGVNLHRGNKLTGVLEESLGWSGETKKGNGGSG